MTTPLTPPADAVARLTKLADDYASRGDFATEDDIRTLLAAYADAARDRDEMRDALETVARIHERHNDCSQVERIQQAYDMRCVARQALAARTGEAR